MKQSFLIPWIILVICSCNKEKDFDCFKSTGDVKSEIRTLPFFNRILLQENIHLVFVPDSVQKVVVEAGEHLMPKIITRVENDSLILDNRNYCNWVRDLEQEVKVYIHSNPDLKVYNRGYGNISGQVTGNRFFMKTWTNANTDLQLQLKTLWIETFKLGNITLSGQVDNASIFRHETGRIDMRPMDRCTFLIYNDHGQGRSYIRADSTLTTVIFDSGEVICVTLPSEIKVEERGTGKLIIRE